jgi:hypothetical protein
VHAGLARGGFGRALCNDRTLPEFWLPARDPQFSLARPDGWRHRYAEAFLEKNRGCRQCLDVLAAVGADAGYTPRDL